MYQEILDPSCGVGRGVAKDTLIKWVRDGMYCFKTELSGFNGRDVATGTTTNDTDFVIGKIGSSGRKGTKIGGGDFA